MHTTTASSNSSATDGAFCLLDECMHFIIELPRDELCPLYTITAHHHTGATTRTTTRAASGMAATAARSPASLPSTSVALALAMTTSARTRRTTTRTSAPPRSRGRVTMSATGGATMTTTPKHASGTVGTAAKRRARPRDIKSIAAATATIASTRPFKGSRMTSSLRLPRLLWPRLAPRRRHRSTTAPARNRGWETAGE